MTEEQKIEAAALLARLDDRRRNYGLLDSDMNRIPKQKELFTDLLNRLNVPLKDRKMFYLYYGGNGSGKCWDPSEPIMMHDGTWKIAGLLEVGDDVMGPDSLPRKVTSTYWGESELYKITPESGEPIIVNNNHQLMLVHRRRDRKGNRQELQEQYSHLSKYVPEGKLVQIGVEEYLNKSTKWKAESYMWRPTKIEFNKKELSVDPYFLGVWLGDGNTDSPGITSIDKEIIAYVYEYAEKIGMRVMKNDITYYIRKNKKSRYGYSAYSHLREIDVLGNKHIPHQYLTSSEEQRLELLAGLIDTDGETSYRKGETPRYSITQKNEKLARDIMFLARSLGFRSSITETIKTCTNATRKDYVPGKYYRISINGDVWRIPCKIERKKHYPQDRRHNKDWLVSKFNVEAIGIGEYVGFTLDGDKMHLDKNFIVHHNTHAGAYVTTLMALGHTTTKYKLPFLGTKKLIWICTKSGSNVRSVIMPYLIGEYSKTRIPPEEIEKLEIEKGLLKTIKLKNGTEIHIKTYDQGQENVQGGTPDWIWLDEEPVNQDVWSELKARARKDGVEMLITMTPLNGLNGVYEFFFNSDAPELAAKCKVYRVSSMDNPYTNKTWTLGMTDEEYRLRVDGTFENPTGLVYSSFSRSRNIIPSIDISSMNGNKFYKAIDFGTSHPTGVIFMMQDEDDNLIIYDEIKMANAELKDIVSEITRKSSGTQFEYFVRDSASKREGLEFQKQFGIFTTPADKRSKGANDMSNRRTGILMINSLFKNSKLFITENCTQLIKELEKHYYKDGNVTKDGEVIKLNDDLLDAMRYCIFLVKKNQTLKSDPPLMKKFKEKIEKKFPTRNGGFRHL